MTATFAERDRVRLKIAKPLPSGRTVQLVGMVWYQQDDGLYVIRIVTPGLYGGGIQRCAADDIERV